MMIHRFEPGLCNKIHDADLSRNKSGSLARKQAPLWRKDKQSKAADLKWVKGVIELLGINKV